MYRDRQPDVEASITLLKTEEGGRKNPALDGYNPNHLIMDGYVTSGVHHYYDKEYIPLGGSALGTITFITPEAYPNSLWEGKIINIQEGSRLVGYAKITKIFNELLRKS